MWSFEQFLGTVPGVRVVCADDEVAARLAAAIPGTRTYGWADDASYRVGDYEGGRTGSRFVLLGDGSTLGTIELPVPGRHNALNAAGAAAVALELGVPFDAVAARARAVSVASRVASSSVERSPG